MHYFIQKVAQTVPLLSHLHDTYIQDFNIKDVLTFSYFVCLIVCTSRLVFLLTVHV
jgi:hypothetical protein